MSESVPLDKVAAIDHIIRDRKQLENIYGEEFNKLHAEAGMYYLGDALLYIDEVRIAAIVLRHPDYHSPLPILILQTQGMSDCF
jgi:hypothetical protein